MTATATTDVATVAETEKKKKFTAKELCEYVVANIPKPLNCDLTIAKPAYDNKVRVNFYKTIESKNSIITYKVIISSKFVMVEEKNGVLGLTDITKG